MTDRFRRWAPYTVALLAVASSIVGITNWFTYDDKYIVELNPLMTSKYPWWRTFNTSYWPRDWGGDGYRPLTMLFFKFETWIGHGIPLPFHATNILLYAVTSVLVFLLAKRLMPVWAAWLAAALFAVHPVHVEAVANVVGQSELLVAIALLVAMILYLREREERGTLRTRTIVLIAICYGLGCMSKEHAIVLPALLGAAELTVIDDGRSLRQRLGDVRLRVCYLSLVLVAVAFVGARSLVLWDHGLGGFQPFTPFSSLKISSFDRVLTAVAVVPQWIRLLLWPARLSSDYGPPDIPIAQGVAIWQLPGFLLVLAVLAFAFLLRRRKPVISFGIAVVCIVLLPSSNFVIPAGIVLAERTLFLPSVGAMLMLAAIAVVIQERIAQRPDRVLLERLAVGTIAVILVAGAVRSGFRSRVWKDNATLFAQAVVDSPDSYRAHYMLGAYYYEQKQNRIGEIQYHRAMELFPYDPFLAFNMAEQYRKFGMCSAAVPLYRWSRGLRPDFPMGRSAFAECLLQLGQYAEAKKWALEALRFGGEVRQARRLIFLADSARAADTRKEVAPAQVGLAGGPRQTAMGVAKNPINKP